MTKSPNVKEHSAHGFTLLEVVIALALFTIGIIATYSMQVAAINTNTSANNLTSASNWARDRIERLLDSPYDCNPFQPNCHDLDDVNGDGTDQDLAGDDGIDDVGPDTNFGLNNATPATADGSATSPDGYHTILWNVAVNTPVNNTKTIRVIVISQDQFGITKTVPMTYIKGSE